MKTFGVLIGESEGGSGISIGFIILLSSALCSVCNHI